MGKRIGNLSSRESKSIGGGDRMRTRRRFHPDLHKWRLGIFMAVLLGLATILVAPAGPTLASITSTSPTPSAQRGANTTQGTKGGNAAGGARGRAAAPCVDKTKRYKDCGNGPVTDSLTGLVWVKKSHCLPPAGFAAPQKTVAGLENGACMLT